VVWNWIAHPEKWYTKNFLPLKYPPLQKEFGLMVIGGKISPELVLTHAPFQEKVQQALLRQEKKEKLGPLDQKRIEVYDRARLFQAIAQGSIPGFFPDPENPGSGWVPISGLADPERRILLESRYSAAELASIQAALAQLVKALRGEGEIGNLEAAQKFSTSLNHVLQSRDIFLDEGKIRMELLYNQIRPFQWAWMLYLLSGLLWVFFKDKFSLTPLPFFVAGFALHTFGFILRCQIAGRPPVTNMYESVIWVAWAAVLFSAVLGVIYRRSLLPAAASWVAAFGLLIGESFPAVLDPSLSALVPVLRNNYWLTVHVLTITLSYGAFALAWGIAHVNLWNFAVHPGRKKENEKLSEYIYRAMQIGIILLAAGTILGGVWANDSWGRFWGWDPKETWALIALLGYLAVLHGRFAGWFGAFGTALGSALCFLGILMAWYGVNFVLAAGFHSYGFGGGEVLYVLGVVLADLTFISLLVFRYNKSRIHIRSLTS
jgi:cytochrome c-type biogenesis protein CcsB